MLKFDPENVSTWTPITVAEYVGALKTQLLFCEGWLEQNATHFRGMGGKVSGRTTTGLSADVLKYLTSHRGNFNAKAIATEIGQPVPSVQSTLARLRNQKQIRRTGPGRYASIGNGGARTTA